MSPPSGSHVWVFDGEAIRPVTVQVGVSEADRTEVAGALEEGQHVVLADAGSRHTSAPSMAWRQIGVRVAGWIEPVQAALASMAQR
jgi:hypothetical protein